MKAQNLLKRPFVDLPMLAMNIKEKEMQELVRELEGIAYRAAFMARYLDYREGHGCGDQGHNTALKKANRAAGLVWKKAFGFNAHHDLSF